MAAISVTTQVPTIVSLEKDRGIYTISFQSSDRTIIHDALSSLVYAGFMTAADAKYLQTLAMDASGRGSGPDRQRRARPGTAQLPAHTLIP
jgi:hypothetical protein